MKLIRFCIITIILVSGFAPSAFSSSLDDLYRDIIRSDNRGYLPLFVKNRRAPVIMIEEDDLPEDSMTKKFLSSSETGVVKLSTEANERTALAKSRQIQWLKTIAAVKLNQVTPLELQDITSRVQENDPKAIEILAWMYTTGTGVSTDFVEAFNLYKKAALLNVANAEKNALIVYKSMNDEQRRRVKNEPKLPL